MRLLGLQAEKWTLKNWYAITDHWYNLQCITFFVRQNQQFAIVSPLADEEQVDTLYTIMNNWCRNSFCVPLI